MISFLVQTHLAAADVGCRLRCCPVPRRSWSGCPLFCWLGVIQCRVLEERLKLFGFFFYYYLRNAGNWLQGAKITVAKCFEHHESDFAFWLRENQRGCVWCWYSLSSFCMSYKWKPVFRTPEYLNFGALEQIGWVVSEIIRFNSFILNVNWFEATGSC